MDIVEPGTEYAVKSLVKRVSIGGTICAGILALVVIMQAITGAMLACATRQEYPLTDEARRRAIDSFVFISTLHNVFAQLSLFTVLFLVALAIVFGLHARAVGAQNTSFRWGPAALAAVLTALLIGIVCHGVNFAHGLSDKKYWLTPPYGGYPPGMPFAKEQIVSSPRFSTFLAIHGIVLPFLVLVIIMFIAPSFYEFAFTGVRRSRKRKEKALKLTGPQE